MQTHTAELQVIVCKQASAARVGYLDRMTVVSAAVQPAHAHVEAHLTSKKRTYSVQALIPSNHMSQCVQDLENDCHGLSKQRGFAHKAVAGRCR